MIAAGGPFELDERRRMRSLFSNFFVCSARLGQWAALFRPPTITRRSEVVKSLPRSARRSANREGKLLLMTPVVRFAVGQSAGDRIEMEMGMAAGALIEPAGRPDRSAFLASRSRSRRRARRRPTQILMSGEPNERAGRGRLLGKASEMMDAHIRRSRRRRPTSEAGPHFMAGSLSATPNSEFSATSRATTTSGTKRNTSRIDTWL